MDDTRTVVGIAGAVGVALALGFGLLMHDGEEPLPDPPASAVVPTTAATDAEAAQLRAQLEFERAARAALEAEVQNLRIQLAALGRSASSAETAPKPDPTSSESAAARKPTGKAFFDDTDLRASGLRDEEIEEIRQHFARAELAELKLRDEARRYGWENKTRHTMELRQLREKVRASMSEEQYDWMLYAAGRDNRVSVDDMLPGSEAEGAGLRRGDVIVRYDGQLLHDANALLYATGQGDAGGTVDVEVLRDGEVVNLRVTRGPLGARFAGSRTLPSH